MPGTSFSVLGDSISTFQGYNPVGYSVYFPEYGEVAHVEDTWWQRVADDLELTLYANGSSAGATVAGDSTETDNPQCGCNELRTNDLSGPEGACPDRVVIFMGANDMLQAVPLGDNDGTGLVEEGEVKTFSDAYTLMLDKVHELSAGGDLLLYAASDGGLRNGYALCGVCQQRAAYLRRLRGSNYADCGEQRTSGD